MRTILTTINISPPTPAQFQDISGSAVLQLEVSLLTGLNTKIHAASSAAAIFKYPAGRGGTVFSQYSVRPWSWITHKWKQHSVERRFSSLTLSAESDATMPATPFFWPRVCRACSPSSHQCHWLLHAQLTRERGPFNMLPSSRDASSQDFAKEIIHASHARTMWLLSVVHPPEREVSVPRAATLLLLRRRRLLLPTSSVTRPRCRHRRWRPFSLPTPGSSPGLSWTAPLRRSGRSPWYVAHQPEAPVAASPPPPAAPARLSHDLRALRFLRSASTRAL